MIKNRNDLKQQGGTLCGYRLFEVMMDDDLGRLSVRELIMRLAATEDTIRRSPATRGELELTEQRIIRELRQREHTVSPGAWRTEQPLAG